MKGLLLYHHYYPYYFVIHISFIEMNLLHRSEDICRLLRSDVLNIRLYKKALLVSLLSYPPHLHHHPILRDSPTLSVICFSRVISHHHSLLLRTDGLQY